MNKLKAIIKKKINQSQAFEDDISKRTYAFTTPKPITCCEDCPLVNIDYDHDYIVCRHPDMDDSLNGLEYAHEIVVLEGCPLKIGEDSEK